jgi:hypothetical protein
MGTLPDGDRARVDTAKLIHYCLSPSHPRGRHKARVFARLGITAQSAEWLRRALLDAAGAQPATPGPADGFGRRFVVDSQLAAPRGTARVRSLWIVRAGESFPRFVTCFVL